MRGAGALEEFIEGSWTESRRGRRRACSTAGVHVTVVPPSAPLAPFVERFAIVETAEAAATKVLLPEPGLMLGLRFAGAARLVGAAAARVPNAAITGVLRSARRMETAAHSGVVVVAFRAGGAAACFAEPLHELFGATVGLDALVPRATLATLEQRLAHADGHTQRVALVEQFLRARLAPDRSDPLALAAVDVIRRAGGQLRIRDLARGLGISQDPLEKRFRRVIGASPKQWASMIRMSRVIAGAGDWARRAIAAGYYDQSHFIREFRGVTGGAPERFFRAGNHC